MNATNKFCGSANKTDSDNDSNGVPINGNPAIGKLKTVDNVISPVLEEANFNKNTNDYKDLVTSPDGIPAGHVIRPVTEDNFNKNTKEFKDLDASLTKDNLDENTTDFKDLVTSASGILVEGRKVGLLGSSTTKSWPQQLYEKDAKTVMVERLEKHKLAINPLEEEVKDFEQEKMVAQGS